MATVELPQYELYVAGGSFPPANGRFYETVDPYTGEPWARVPDADEQDVERAVRAARTAFEGEWGAMTGFQRAKLMHRLADLIERDANRLAELESRDSGKLLREFSGQMRAIPSGITTSPAGPTRSPARASRPPSRTSWPLRGASLSASWPRSYLGTRRCCS